MKSAGDFFDKANIFQNRNFTPGFHQNNIDKKRRKRYNYVKKNKLFPSIFSDINADINEKIFCRPASQGAFSVSEYICGSVQSIFG